MRIPKQAICAAATLCIALIATACTSASTNNSSAMEQNQASTDKARNLAYYEKCQEYLELYGSPSSVLCYNASYASGLCVVNPIDMNGDGQDELVLSYQTADDIKRGIFKKGVEIWSYRDGEANCDFKGEVSLHGTNGYFPYIEVFSRNDTDGAAIVVRNCYGSSPISLTYNVYGYRDDGSFGCLIGGATGGTEQCRYIAINGTGDSWQPTEWEVVDEETYQAAFSFLDSTPILHLHLFSELKDNFDEPTSSMADMLSETRATIEDLASKAK